MKISLQKPHTGSKWYYGNFNLGLLFDGHPRFYNIVFCFIFFEIVIELYNTYDKKYPEETNGSKIAADLRKSCNKLTSAEREESYKNGFDIIYNNK